MPLETKIRCLHACATIAAIALAAGAPTFAADPVEIATFVAIARPTPNVELRYGSAPAQAIDLFLPDGPGPHPVALLIHGGCWSATTAGREQLRPLGADLARRGIAAWSIGYQRANEAGGGYPGTFRDVATAIDRLPTDASRFKLDLGRTVLVGHSAGGHLALWGAARASLPITSPLHVAAPFLPRAVISLGGIGDLEAFAPLIPMACGPGILDRLTGAPAAGRPDVYADISPAALRAPDVQIVMISGVLDRLTPPYVAYDYARAVRAHRVRPVEMVNVADAGHFDLVTPDTPAWNEVTRQIESALKR